MICTVYHGVQHHWFYFCDDEMKLDAFAISTLIRRGWNQLLLVPPVSGVYIFLCLSLFTFISVSLAWPIKKKEKKRLYINFFPIANMQKPFSTIKISGTSLDKFFFCGEFVS